MLSFERQPFPAPCHVDQDVAHSRAWRALRHLTTFDRVLSALHRRNHLPVPPGPCTQPMLPRGSRCGQHLSRPEYTLGPIVTFAPQHTLRALRVRTLCAARPPAGFRVISKARSTSPATEKGRGIGCRALRPHGSDASYEGRNDGPSRDVLGVFSGSGERTSGSGNKGRWWAIGHWTRCQFVLGMDAEPRSKAATQGLYTQWVAGFGSGVSWETDDPDILTGMDFDGLMAWVHDYCKANPLAKVTTGAAMLVQELRARAQRK